MEKSEKEYGKLSLDQFKRLVDELPEIRSQMQEIPKLAQSTSSSLKKYQTTVVLEKPPEKTVAY